MSAGQSRELALRVWDACGEPMMVVDPRTLRIVAANDPACERLGYGRDEIAGENVTSIECSIEDMYYWDDARAGTYAGLERVKRYYRRRDGAVVMVEKRVSLLGQGEFDGRSSGPLLLISFRDAREDDGCDEELGRSSALLRATLEATADGILVTDSEGGITNMNHRFAQMWGIPADLIERRDDAAIHAHLMQSMVDPVEYERRLAEATRAGGSNAFDTLPLTQNRWIERFVTPLVVGGRPSGHVYSFRDVTSQRQAEARLAQLNTELEEHVALRTEELGRANRELEAFSYSVSHDLRAPLRAITGFSSIVLDENQSRLDPDSVELLHRIQGGAVRMAQLIDDLLALSRVSRQQMERRSFSLSELARQVFDVLGQAHPGREVEVVVTPGMFMDGDPSLMRVVLDNLVGNAWKFTSRREQARIEVGTIETGEGTACFIRDNGAGFDMRYAHKLFGAFQRLHMQDEFEGTGIGLSIVQRIIHRHGGRVWAESELDRGATFYFTLAPARD